VRVALATVIAAVLAYAPYKFLDEDGARQLDKLRGQLRDTEHEITALREENARYRRDIHALKTDPAAIEEIARDERGMVYDGEIVIRVVPREGDDE